MTNTNKNVEKPAEYVSSPRRHALNGQSLYTLCLVIELVLELVVHLVPCVLCPLWAELVHLVQKGVPTHMN